MPILFSVNEATASNASGEPLKPGGRPAFDGDKMIKLTETNVIVKQIRFQELRPPTVKTGETVLSLISVASIVFIKTPVDDLRQA